MSRTTRWGLYLGLAATVALGAALLAITRAPAAGPVAVDIKEFKYLPGTLSVARGSAITWTNHDEEAHTVTSSAGAFASAGLSRDEKFTQKFPAAGTYAYFCALHPQMRATVVVR